MTPDKTNTSDLSLCCSDAIQTYASNNPMIVCDGCQKLIKCFSNNSSFLRYIRFCQSREKKFFTFKTLQFDIVIFDRHHY